MKILKNICKFSLFFRLKVHLQANVARIVLIHILMEMFVQTVFMCYVVPFNRHLSIGEFLLFIDLRIKIIIFFSLIYIDIYYLRFRPLLLVLHI